MHYEWQHIEFTSGACPYICKTEDEFRRIKRNCKRKKFEIKHLYGRFWLIDDKKDEINMFYIE